MRDAYVISGPMPCSFKTCLTKVRSSNPSCEGGIGGAESDIIRIEVPVSVGWK